MVRKNFIGKLLSATCLMGSLLLCPIANAEIRTYEGTGEYVMSDFETPDLAKQRAKARAEQNAQEKAGVFVNSYTQTKNFQVTEDEVIVIASGIMKVVDTVYAHEGTADGFLYRATIKADIDTDEINKWLERGVQERSAMAAQNKELQDAIAKQNLEIERLKKQLSEKNSDAEKAKLKEEITNADNAFLASQKIDEGYKLYWNGDYSGAIARFSEAVEMDGRSAIAYRNRGTAYANLQRYDQAASDFSRAIAIDPADALAYVGRGAAYICLGNFSQASVDLTKAIEIDPNNGLAYYNRGACYQAMGNKAAAQADFAKANALGCN